MQQIVDTLLAEIRRLPPPPAGRPLLIALDGRCAAGKSTLAAALQAETGCNVVSMDHFFLRPEQRTAVRLEEPGGNVDRERFREEVLLPLSAGKAVSYRPYNCHLQELDAPIRLDSAPLAVVEGAYSCHPALWDFYDLRVFLTVSPDEQLRRLRSRNGLEGAVAFQNRWIPLEEKYFAAFRIRAGCQLCFETDGVEGAE